MLWLFVSTVAIHYLVLHSQHNVPLLNSFSNTMCEYVICYMLYEEQLLACLHHMDCHFVKHMLYATGGFDFGFGMCREQEIRVAVTPAIFRSTLILKPRAIPRKCKIVLSLLWSEKKQLIVISKQLVLIPMKTIEQTTSNSQGKVLVIFSWDCWWISKLLVLYFLLYLCDPLKPYL